MYAVSTPTLRCAAVQFEAVPDRPDLNLATIVRLAREAANDHVQFVAFPEMCLLGYWHLRRHTAGRLQELAQPADGEHVSVVRELAVELGIGIGVGFLELGSNGRLFNSYAVALPDGTVHTHRKLHAFEHEAVSSGDRFTVFDTPWGVRMGVLICWDNNLVENVRATALLGAVLLVAPHQTGGTNSRSPRGMKPVDMEVWANRASDAAAIEAEFRGPKGRGWLMRWLPSRAHDNGIFVLFSNGVGRDDDEVRTGNSMVIDPYGEVIAETWAAGEAVVAADLDFGLVPLSTGQRWIRGRRPELYGLLGETTGSELDPRSARFSDAPVLLPRRVQPLC